MDGNYSNSMNTKSVNEVAPPEEPKEAVIVNCLSLNIRDAASKDGKILCVLDAGTKVLLAPIENPQLADGWTPIYLCDGNGVSGYVMTEFIKEV